MLQNKISKKISELKNGFTPDWLEPDFILRSLKCFSPYPFHRFTKGKDEFFFKENKLINYRQLVFYDIPYKGNPVFDSLINFDYIGNYWFKDIVIEITEDSYYCKDEECIKITKKQTKAPVIDFENALKEAPEKELHPMMKNKPDLIGKSYVRDAKKLIDKLRKREK